MGNKKHFDKSIKILVVEDNIINIKFIQKALENVGVDFDCAVNGKEAIEKNQQKSYDLILMDCQMPIMDGYQATEHIRLEEKDGAHIPIVALTAHSFQENIQQCFDAGMDDYICKPVKIEKLVEILEKHLSDKQKVSQEYHLTITQDMITSIMEEYNFDEFETKKFIEEYYDFLNTTLDQLEVAIKKSDFVEIRQLAHKLNGASKYLGFSTISDICVKTERTAEQSDMVNCILLQSELKKEMCKLFK